jgi:hypothetical protein
MIRKTVTILFLSFAYAGFGYAEITETELSDGTIVRSTTTRITNAGTPVDSNSGYRQDEAGNRSYRNGNWPIIYLNPYPGHGPKTGSTPKPGHGQGYTQNPDHVPYTGGLPDKGHFPGFDSDR